MRSSAWALVWATIGTWPLLGHLRCSPDHERRLAGHRCGESTTTARSVATGDARPVPHWSRHRGARPACRSSPAGSCVIGIEGEGELGHSATSDAVPGGLGADVGPRERPEASPRRLGTVSC